MGDLLVIDGVAKEFGGRRLLKGSDAVIAAVSDVSLAIAAGETLGIVGESGSGKSTLGRIAIGLMPPTRGRVLFDGQDLSGLTRRESTALRRRAQMVFQDPLASLDPRMSVGEIVTEGLRIHRIGTRRVQREQAVEVLELVGMRAADLERYPREFSGGQRQRIGIARAIVMKPDFVLFDEPVSALDVSVQAQVLNLLVDLKERLGLTYGFVAHDMAVVGYLSDRIAVMYQGRLVELAPTATLLSGARHPYTVELLAAVPKPVPARRSGVPVRPDRTAPDPSTGCPFRLRCPVAQEICATKPVELLERAPGHWSACHFERPLPADAPVDS